MFSVSSKNPNAVPDILRHVPPAPEHEGGHLRRLLRQSQTTPGIRRRHIQNEPHSDRDQPGDGRYQDRAGAETFWALRENKTAQRSRHDDRQDIRHLADEEVRQVPEEGFPEGRTRGRESEARQKAEEPAKKKKSRGKKMACAQ